MAEMEKSQSPAPKKPKNKILYWALFIVIICILALYTLDKLIPAKMRVYFRLPGTSEKKEEVKTDKEEENESLEEIFENEDEGKPAKSVRAAGTKRDDSSNRINSVQEIMKTFKFSYPDWAVNEWNYNIDHAKGKKIAKSVFASELNFWNIDMLGDANTQKLKQGIQAFKLKEEEDKNSGEKVESEPQDKNGAETGADTADSASDDEGTVADQKVQEPAKRSTKTAKKPKPILLEPYSYKISRFMPGLTESGYFIDYEGIDIESSVSGQPDFVRSTIMRRESFKNNLLSFGNGGSIVYEIEGGTITDQDGPDFVIYGDSGFTGGIKTAKVEVAEEDTPSAYIEFPCDSVIPPFKGCAGIHQVNSSKSSDIILAGGDAYDLARIGVKRAKFIRITDTGDNKSQMPETDGFNLDSIALVHAYKK
jgi:hypothetical protein